MLHPRFLLLASALSCYVLSLSAADTLRIDQRVWSHRRADQHLIQQVWQNPALPIFRQRLSLTEAGLSAFVDRETESRTMQVGEGGYGWAFTAASVVAMNPTSEVSGRASYTNQRQRNVRWNESADYAYVYPYVMGDPQGGDMKSETYQFYGAYNKRWKAYSWGAQLHYRAIMAYREVDPRPKNTVSDLFLVWGGSYQFHPHYRVGLSLEVGKYKQDNTLRFFTPLGGSSVYHLTGLGTHYVRFAGKNTEALYDGRSWGGSLEVTPTGLQGVYTSFRFRQTGYEKLLTGLNDLPLVDLQHRTASAELAYQTYGKGIKLHYTYSHRKGRENLYGAPSGNIFPLVTQVNGYTDQLQTLSLTAVYGSSYRRYAWNVQPRLTFLDHQQSHALSTRFIHHREVETSLQGEVHKGFKQGSLTVGLHTAYLRNLSNSWQLDSETSDNLLKELTEQDIHRYQSHTWGGSIDIRWDMPLSFLRGGWYIQLHGGMWHHTYPSQTYHSSLAVGITL